MNGVSLIAESDDWLVVSKPPNLQIHPKKPGGSRTLWDQLRELLAFEIVNGGQVSIINRLDRETSGLVLVAKNARTARRFHDLMERRAFSKEYLAIVWGWPGPDEFAVDAPIIRQGEILPSRIYVKRCIHPAGASALTRFRVERRFRRRGERFSLVRAFPVTGRTHQIRLHLSHAGYPIIGDKIYGPDEACYLEFIETGWTPSLAARLLLPRHALHSARLRLEHDSLEWNAPLTDDLEQWLAEAKD